MYRQRLLCFVILFLLIAVMTSCNFPFTPEDSTLDSPATVAARTLEVVSTQVSSRTEVLNEEALPSGATSTTDDSSSDKNESECLNKAVFVEDITFRDKTQIESGASFIKIWRLRNDGTCIWNQSYSLAFIGGERMSAPTETALTQVIQPGQTIDLSINMIAPEVTGVYQGFWRLHADNGEFFGIGSNGDQSFWVQINVISSHTVTPTIISTTGSTSTSIPQPETTATPSFTSEPTQAIQYQGSNTLTTSQSIDLDTGEISPQNGVDLSLSGSTTAESSLVSQNTAKFSLMPDNSIPPNPDNCQEAALSEDPILITSLAVNDIICYSTDVGRYGYLNIVSLNSNVEFTFITWGP